MTGMGQRAAAAILAVLVATGAGCGFVDDESAGEATDRSDQERPATTSTTTTSATRASVDRVDVYREMIDREATPPNTERPPEYCFAMDVFVFEATQMLIQPNPEAMRERLANAESSLDLVVHMAPPEMSGPAGQLRAVLEQTVSAPGATDSTESFTAAVMAMVEQHAGLIDGLYATTIDVCDVKLSEPIRSSAEGIASITGS